MRTINYSDGRAVPSVVVVWEDWNSERSGYFRAYWCSAPDGTSGSPVIGYCSAGGSHRTIKAVAAEVRRLYPGERVYRAPRGGGRIYEVNLSPQQLIRREMEQRKNFGPGNI